MRNRNLGERSICFRGFARSMTFPLAFGLLVSAAWGDSPPTAPPVPSVRDAYVERRGVINRSARLTDTLTVTVCKGEYDAWIQVQHPTPAIVLYLDGVL